MWDVGCGGYYVAPTGHWISLLSLTAQCWNNVMLYGLSSRLSFCASTLGTAFMYHKDLVTTVQDRFMAVYAACVQKYTAQNQLGMLWVCGIDQGHFTRMKESTPELFVSTGVGE